MKDKLGENVVLVAKADNTVHKTQVYYRESNPKSERKYTVCGAANQHVKEAGDGEI